MQCNMFLWWLISAIHIYWRDIPSEKITKTKICRLLIIHLNSIIWHLTFLVFEIAWFDFTLWNPEEIFRFWGVLSKFYQLGSTSKLFLKRSLKLCDSVTVVIHANRLNCINFPIFVRFKLVSWTLLSTIDEYEFFQNFLSRKKEVFKF